LSLEKHAVSKTSILTPHIILKGNKLYL